MGDRRKFSSADFAPIWDGPETGAPTVILAHGAGAPADSPFMACMATGLAAEGVRVMRFSFPYMAERMRTGRRRPPDPMPVLQASWQAAIDRCGDPGKLVIGGKSMGGRVASMIADQAGVAGLVCLGYPFHPAGKPDRLRVAHLANLQTPTLVVQGERDRLGDRDTVAGVTLSPAIRIRWLPDGDHGFKPRKASGLTEAENLDAAIDAVARFVFDLRATHG